MNAILIHSDGSTEPCVAHLQADGSYVCVVATSAFALVCTIQSLLMW